MNLASATVAVTGAGGFIGSHLTERLAREGARVRALVHYNGAGRRGWLDESPIASDIEITAGDIADADLVRSFVAGADVVFHLAALIGIPYSYHAPRSYVATNVEGTLNVLQAAKDHGVARVIHTSTSEVYGSAQRVPIDEAHPINCQSPYAATKSAADQLAGSFHASFGTPVVTIRPFNTFGPRQSQRAVIPTIIAQCLAGPNVHRGRIELGALDTTRDLNFVGNTVDGFVRAATAPDDIHGEVINLGSGREIAIGDLARTIIDLTGADAEVVSTAERRRPDASEVDRLLADASKARALLGWRAEVSLEDGLERTIAWFRDRSSAQPGDGARREAAYVI